MGNTSRVAVLLASYNGSRYIVDQIATILWQVDVSIQIFVRDDGSTDGTDQVLRELVAQYPENITIVSDNCGPSGSASENFFLLLQFADIENYDYVAFADQDDIWLPSKLMRAIDLIVRNGGGGYSSDLVAWNAHKKTGQPLEKIASPTALDYLFQGASAGCTYVLDQKASMTVRSRIAKLNYSYCSHISHDWTIYAICRSSGQKWRHDDQAHIMYRQHQSNVYGAMLGWSGLFARFKMLSSGWYKEHILWLTHVVNNNIEERAAFEMLKRDIFLNRCRLAWRAGNYRRSTAGKWLLRFAFVFGLIK